jgi:hypothetical protein
MTDRDQFAMAALPSAIALASIATTTDMTTELKVSAEAAARYAYQMADAMLKERDK